MLILVLLTVCVTQETAANHGDTGGNKSQLSLLESKIHDVNDHGAFQISEEFAKDDHRFTICAVLRNYVAAKMPGLKAESDVKYFYDCEQGSVISFDIQSQLATVLIYGKTLSPTVCLVEVSDEMLADLLIDMSMIRQVHDYFNSNGPYAPPGWKLTASRAFSYEEVTQLVAAPALKCYKTESGSPVVGGRPGAEENSAR